MTAMAQVKHAGAGLQPSFAVMLRCAEFTQVLAMATRWRYAARVPEKKGAGLGRLNTQSAQTAQCGFFSCFCLCMSPMSGGGGDALGRAGFFGYQSTNPTICRSPRLVAGRGLTATQGGTMPSNTRTFVRPQSEQIRVLAGVDVAQLLRDIGEASANTGPVDLFRLCLDAQRLLTDMQIGSAPATTSGEVALRAPFRAMDGAGANSREEAQLLESFRSMDDDTRFSMLQVGLTLAEKFPRHRPKLALVKSGQVHSVEAV